MMRTRSLSLVATSVLALAAVAPAAALAGDGDTDEVMTADVDAEADTSAEAEVAVDDEPTSDTDGDATADDTDGDTAADDTAERTGTPPHAEGEDGEDRDGEASDEHRPAGDRHDDFSDNEAIDDRGKIHVCKYVGQPGVDERLKDGKNPIVVSWTTLRPTIVQDASEVHVGLRWVDAHDESHLVIAPSTTCPEPEGPPIEDEGALLVTKQVHGDDAPAGASFTFDIVCGASSWHDVTLRAGESWGPQQLPAGTDCTVTETDHAGADEVRWQLGDGTETAGTTAHLRIEADTTAALTYTNHFDDEVAPVEPMVDVTLAKAWTGDEVDEDDVTVRFTIDGTEHRPGDQVSVAPGATVTITGEMVTGLPEGCTYEAASLIHTTATFGDWTASEQEARVRAETFTVTNEVDCEGVVADDGAITLDKEALEVGDDNTVLIDELDGTVDVTYRYTISNTGDLDLDLATFSDDRIGDLFDELPTTSLPVGGAPIVVDVTTSLAAEDFDGEGATHTNVAVVTTEQGPDAQADETITLIGVGDEELEAGISLEKEALVTSTADGIRFVALGPDGTVDVTYRFTITNTGDVDLTLDGFADSHFGFILDELQTTSLPAGGEPLVLELMTTLNAEDFDAEEGWHLNVAIVTTEEGPEDEAEEIVYLVDVLDEVPTPPAVTPPTVTPPTVTPPTVTPAVTPPTEVLGVVAERAAQLPVTGSSLLSLLLGALVALGLGAGLLKLRPARTMSRGREDG
jgi:hypothetical protein